MMQSIAIRAYFDWMRKFFTRQGFDGTMKVVYSADAEGPQKLLNQDIVDKDTDRKQGSNRDTVRSDPYTYLFWTRDSLRNVIRRSVKLRDGVTNDGIGKFKKTVSASFGMGCVLVSNKANLIEDFSEAFASEYQNIHNVPINLKFGYDTRTGVMEGGFNTEGLNITLIQELGTEELVSFQVGDLFSYSWDLTLYLNFVSEFAEWTSAPVERLVVDLYNPNGVPLSSMDMAGAPQWTEHTASDGTVVQVPKTTFVEVVR